MRTATAFVAAWRSLAFAPANTLAVVMALVFAVGAWHAVGAVWDSTVGLGLPYRAPEELVAVNGAESATPFGRFFSDREAALLRERADSFVWVGHLWGASMTLGDPAARSLSVEALEPGFLEVLGVSPLLGRPVPPRMGGHHKVEVAARFREGPTAEQLAALSRLPSEVDASMRATATASVRERRIRQLGAPLLAAVALGIFAVAGLLLAVVGGIGHIADFVVREAHATAVRMALGADPDLLVWGAFRSTALAAAAGVSLGTLLGWFVSRAVAARVPWIETGDPLFYLGPAALLLLVMLIASAAAGFRTLRGDPWAALRSL